LLETRKGLCKANLACFKTIDSMVLCTLRERESDCRLSTKRKTPNADTIRCHRASLPSRERIRSGDFWGFQRVSRSPGQEGGSKRRNGGGCSLNRTALSDQFPVSGKNTGYFLSFYLVAAGNASIRLCSGCLLRSRPRSRRKKQGI